jgi:hypothetical protein
MDKFDNNVLSNILKFAPKESVNLLVSSSQILSAKINKLEEDQVYWKIRSESLLNKTIPDQKITDWKNIKDGFSVQRTKGP